MKHKSLLVVFACVLVVSFVFGTAGGITFAKDETADGAYGGKDRLVGVFITTEYLDLFNFESYLNENTDKILSGGEISQSDSDRYQDKLYATLVDDAYTDSETGEIVTTKKYVFEGVDGIAYFCASYTDAQGTYLGNGGEKAITDANTAINSTDAGDSFDLNGTIYVAISAEPTVFYYNPVYQEPSGRVYAVTGHGMSYGDDLVTGMSGSQKLEDAQTVTIDGKSETLTTSIEVSTCYIDTPTGTRILQFDKENHIVSAQNYAPGSVPDKLTAAPNAEYMIVETCMRSVDGAETTARELFQPKDERLFAFSCREDGVCIKQYCSIIWS